ncbi:MAG: c-type cytochrome [Gemmatimonadota bacterium]
MLLAWTVLFAGYGCPWFSNMADQPSVQTFEHEPRPTIPGTVPVGYELPPAVSYEAANALANPVPASPATLERGEQLYATYCAVCHGAAGVGDGPVVEKFLRPPTLMGASRGYTDGYIYALVTNGRGNMPSYNRMSPVERWEVIHYLRRLQSGGAAGAAPAADTSGTPAAPAPAAAAADTGS